MLKRTISMLLVLVLILGILPVTAGAADPGPETLDGSRNYAAYDEAEDNDSMATAGWIEIADAYVYGEVGSDDGADWFGFTIYSCQRLYLYAVSGADGVGSTCFSLHDAGGSLIRYANYLGVDGSDDVFELEIDLEPGTYYIQVTDPYNWVEYIFSASLTPLLETPRVTASNRAADGKIKLSWDAVTGAGPYYIIRADNEVFINPVLFYTSDTSYIDTSAVAGVTYYYKIYASSVDPDYLNSMYCAPVARTCDLPRPTGVKAIRSASTGKVRISWSAVPGADGYTLSIYDADGALVKSTTTAGTVLTHSSATLGTEYSYRVKAIDSDVPAANSAWSSTVKGTAICAAPVVTVGNVASTGKIKISWTAVDGARSYDFYRSADGTNWTMAASTTGTSLKHSSANPGEVWYYKVIARGAAAGTDSEASEVKSGICALPAPVLTLTVNSAGKARLSWTAVPGAVQYRIYCSTDGGSTYSLLNTMTGTAVTHSSAVPGQTYCYKIVAVASVAAADSACSAAKTHTVRLSAPVLTLTANSKGKPRLTWTAVSGAVKYNVYGSADGGAYTLLTTITGTAVTHSSAKSGVTYSYKIEAVAPTAAANSAHSNIRSMTSG